MKYLKELATGLEVDPVLDELDAHPELWNQHTLRTTFERSPHQVDDIWVRYRAWTEWEELLRQAKAEKAKNPHFDYLPERLAGHLFVGDPHDSAWYPGIDVLPSLRTLIFEVMHHWCVERLGGVLITRIPPGGEVKPHIDRGWHATYYEKIAVQLRSAPEQAFCFADGEYRCAAGAVYTFDNSHEHWVSNPSAVERMTAIICVRRDPRGPRLVDAP